MEIEIDNLNLKFGKIRNLGKKNWKFRNTLEMQMEIEVDNLNLKFGKNFKFGREK